MDNQIKITLSDYRKLISIIKKYRTYNKLKSRHLLVLAEKLENAEILDDNESLTDLVLINSTVVYKNLDNNNSSMVTIVFSADASRDGSRISILSPLGTALIGEKENSVVDCFTPGGRKKLRIDKIISHHSVIQH